ncbi:MAG: aldose 1-epimerase family protein [Candidatus Brocadiae bacterium]|nr:aldose 1-epimerase family protein [Candidatus Brocadiia bacterium]
MPGCFQEVLTDVTENVYRDCYQLSSDNFPGMECPSWCVRKFTLKGGKQHGVDVVSIDNGHMTVVVVPTRGMNIQEAHTADLRLGWNSPVKGMVHPAYVDEEARGGLGWIEGFTELMCRCGLAFHGAPGEDFVSDNTGAQTSVMLPLHGTISNTPATRVVVRVDLGPPHALSVLGEVVDSRMFGPSYRLVSTVSTVPGSAEFTVSDRMENVGGSSSELELLYHCNYGPPLLGEGSRLLAPVQFICPRDARAKQDMATWNSYGPPEPGFVEQCYFLRMHSDRQGRTVVALADPQGDCAATIRYSVNELPAFTIWRNTAAQEDGYVTGLEPATDYPNARSFERSKGRVIELPSTGAYEVSLTFGLVVGGDQVARLRGEISSLTEGKETTVCEDPDSDYCPM